MRGIYFMAASIKTALAALKQKYQSNVAFRKSVHILGISIFAISGIVLAGISLASTPSSQVIQNRAAGECGARVKNYSYQVPFGDAPWNVPVCGLTKHPRSAEYASRMYNYGVYNDETADTKNNKGKFGVSFGFEEPDKNWTRAVYYASDATTTKKVQTCANNCNMSNFDDGENIYSPKAWLPDREFPWNPKWNVASAGDNELIIIDEAKGYLYSFSSVKTGATAFTQCFPWDQKRLCASSARILRDHNDKIVDYRTFEGSDGSRGGGINYYATLLTPQEVAAGEVRHALGMGIFNSAFGPECTEEQLAKNDPRVIDVTCGTAVAPAAKFEWASVKSLGERLPRFQGQAVDKAMTLSKTVPEGMRFALDIDDAFIENWINSKPDLKNNPRKAQTARIIARALRDYGWMPLDTSGYGSGIQTAGGMSDKNRKLWEELGITDKKDDNILHGLFTQDNIYVVEPPVNNCVNGKKSKFYCKYTSSKYPASATGTSEPVTTPSTPTPTQPTTPTTPTNPAPPTPPGSGPTAPTPPASPVVTPTSVSVPTKVPVSIGWNPQLFEFHQAANLSWSASDSPHGIAKYIVRKNGKQLYSGSNRSYTDFKIDDGQKYKYEITAVDKKGNISKTTTYEKTLRCTWFGWVCNFQ